MDKIEGALWLAVILRAKAVKCKSSRETQRRREREITSESLLSENALLIAGGEPSAGRALT
jgi:hypothetical protein